MSTATDSHETAHDDHADHADHGLSDLGYIKVALILAALTGLEVSTYFFDFGVIEVPSLLILMVVKFEIVVAYFMHLKFDNKVFTILFVAGLVLAVAVFAALVTSMAFWQDPAGCDIGQFC